MEAEIRADSTSFHGAYRMTPATFMELLELISPHIRKQTTVFRDPIGEAERLGMTLRFVDHAVCTCCVGRRSHVGPSMLREPHSEFARWFFFFCIVY